MTLCALNRDWLPGDSDVSKRANCMIWRETIPFRLGSASNHFAFVLHNWGIYQVLFHHGRSTAILEPEKEH